MNEQAKGRRSNLRPILSLLGLLSSLSIVACATPDVPVEPAASHPFPKWVSELETGLTRADQIRARFGEPNQARDSVRGGTIWWYSFAEVRSSDGQSGRPAVSANAKSQEGVGPRFDAFKQNADQALDWFSRLVFYPPSQPRPPRLRRVPALVHDLELALDVDGTLRRVQYTPQQGTTLVRGDD